MKMKNIRYTDKFKSETVKQITDRGSEVVGLPSDWLYSIRDNAAKYSYRLINIYKFKAAEWF